ncbi:Probable RNA-directed DNA polymerase from transposon X-element [Eumeta japonica]|uniref:Probable RNA-directed DNA polymerase from transposon X-element n=1 Tax=Eumeta variegata TaxID=151549 RepID=A0A4C1ZJI2_EUMVA|nr:Probable RNA-directed DNA polymerase from transposon X-element [Eumeta japonica]
MVIQPVRPRSRHPARRLRAKPPRDSLCRDAHLEASIRQSRADGIPCRSAATDEVLKVPNYWDYGQRPTIRTVLTYASPVFAHAAPKALHRLQVIQNKFCRAATDAHWCVRNSILHRDLELPTLSKYMKDASKRFFDIAGSHPNALLRAAVDYQPPPPHPLYPKTTEHRSRPGRRNGNRPVTVPGDILCRGDTLQVSSIGHVTPSALTCRPAAFGEAIEVVRPVARLTIPRRAPGRWDDASEGRVPALTDTSSVQARPYLGAGKVGAVPPRPARRTVVASRHLRCCESVQQRPGTLAATAMERNLHNFLKERGHLDLLREFEAYCASPASPDAHPQVVVFDPEMDVEFTLPREPKKRPATVRPSEGTTSDSESSDTSDHSDFTTVRRRKASKASERKPEASYLTQASDGSTYYRITPSSKKPKKANIAEATASAKTRSIYDSPVSWRTPSQPTTASQGAVEAGKTKAAAPAAAKNSISDEADVTAPSTAQRGRNHHLCSYRTKIGGPSCAKNVQTKTFNFRKHVIPLRD